MPPKNEYLQVDLISPEDEVADSPMNMDNDNCY